MTLQHLLANSEDIWIDFFFKKIQRIILSKAQFNANQTKRNANHDGSACATRLSAAQKSHRPQFFPPHSAPCVKKPFRAKNNPHKFKTHQGIDPCRAGGEQTSVSSQLGLPTGRED